MLLWNEGVSAFNGKNNMDIELGIGVCHGCYVSPIQLIATYRSAGAEDCGVARAIDISLRWSEEAIDISSLMKRNKIFQ